MSSRDNSAKKLKSADNSAKKTKSREASATKNLPQEETAPKTPVQESSAKKSVQLENSAKKSIPVNNSAKKSQIKEDNVDKATPIQASGKKSAQLESSAKKSAPVENSGKKSNTRESSADKVNSAPNSARKSNAVENSAKKSEPVPNSAKKSIVAENSAKKSIVAENSAKKSSAPKSAEKAAASNKVSAAKSAEKAAGSNKGSKSKDALEPADDEVEFRALYSGSKSKKQSIEKEPEVEVEEEDDEELAGGDLEEEKEDLQGEDEGEDDEEGDFEAEGFGQEGEDEEGDELGEEDELDELEGVMPAGMVGFGNEPDPDDEFKVDDDEGARRPKIMGMGPGSTEVDMAIIKMKIEEILKILVRFKELRDPLRTRQSYLEELKENMCTYYGYNGELIDLFLNTFTPGECVQFLEANEQPRPSTIRTNTLKTNRKHLAQILQQRGVNLEPLAEWSKVGIKIFESKVPLGATPEYLAGHYMLQSASSFLPVIALAPQVNDRVLDMAAAPGGKTTYIAQLMKNTGIVLANDFKPERLKSLKFNLQRLGVTNTMICNYDGRKLPKVMKGFDRVLLDAPCTGLGIIAKDPSIKTQRLFIDVKKMSHLQKEMITAAIDCCRPGGYVVYSTCSVTVEENEWVVDYALRNRFVKLVDPGVEIGEEGYTKYMEKRFDNSLKLSRRILPHIHNMDGFYFAKFQKISNGDKKTVDEKLEAGNAKAAGKDAKKAKGKQGDKKQKVIVKMNKGPVEEQQGEVAATQETPAVAGGADKGGKKKNKQNKKNKQVETGKREAETIVEEIVVEEKVVETTEETFVPELRQKNKQKNKGKQGGADAAPAKPAGEAGAAGSQGNANKKKVKKV